MLQVLQYSCYTMSNKACQTAVPGARSTESTSHALPERDNSDSSTRLPAAGQLALRDRIVDFSRCEVRFDDGARNELSECEARLLRYLAGNPGRVISREEILAEVWHLKSQRIFTRVIDMHVAHLREKLRDRQARLLRTVYGEGYMFVGAIN